MCASSSPPPTAPLAASSSPSTAACLGSTLCTYKFVWRQDYQDVVALLLQDGLVSQRMLDLVTAASASLQRASATGGSPSRRETLHMTPSIISAFGQEFDFRYAVDLNFCGVFASPDAILTHYMRYITTYRVPVQGKYVQYSPFEGDVPSSSTIFRS